MKCENCGKEHNGMYGSGRFCCEQCARSFSTKNDKIKTKQAKCVQCGKLILIRKRASTNNCMCDDCKKQNEIKNSLTYCKICGRPYYSKIEKCPNNFCNKTKNIFDTLIKYFDFDETKLGTDEVEIEYNRIKNNLYNLYWNENKSFSDIAEIYNYNQNPGNLTKIFRELNINRRNFKECTSLSWINGKHLTNKPPQYMCGWHTTWNNKEVYLHSSYEFDYAKKLDEQKINYEVECFRIKYFDTQTNMFRCSIPDFYISETNTIVEIKSSWTLNIQNLKDRIKAYNELGYNFKLIYEHEEVDIDNIENTNIYKETHKPKYGFIKGSFCWIYKYDNFNKPINRKCHLNNLDSYIKQGWKKGRKLK